MPRAVAGVYEKQPGSGVWYVRIRVSGKIVRKAIGTRQQATEYAEKARTIKRTGTGILPTTARQAAQTFREIEQSRTGAKVSELIDDYLAWQDRLHDDNPDRLRDQAGMRQRIEAIQNALGSRVAASLKVPDIKGYLETLKHAKTGKPIAPATMNRYKSTLSAVFTYAKTVTLKVDVHPVRDLKHYEVKDPPPRYMTDAEETKIREVIQKWIAATPEGHKFTRLLLRQHLNELTVAAGTGMRKGNQYALRWEDLDFDTREIHLPITKNGEAHVVPMIDDVYNALRDQQEIIRAMDKLERKTREDGSTPRGHAGERVFCITENREWWKKAKCEAGIRNLNWHQCSRHTAGSRLGQAKVPLSYISAVLGHKTLEMAKRYTHLERSHLSEAMMALNRASRSA